MKNIQNIDTETLINIRSKYELFFSPYLNLIDKLNISECEKINEQRCLETTRDEIDLYEKIIGFYTAIASFPTKERIEKIKTLFSLTDKNLLWVSNFEDISLEIELINSSGDIYLSKSIVYLHYYLQYMPLKIHRQLLRDFRFEKIYDSNKLNLAQIELFKFFQNKSNREKKGVFYPKNEFEDFIIDLLNLITLTKSEPIDKLTASEILKLQVSGNLDTAYIKPIFNKIIHLKEGYLKTSQIYQHLFRLFKVLMKEKNWLSQEEFENQDKFDEIGNPIGLYGGNYARYQTSVVKKFIEKK